MAWGQCLLVGGGDESDACLALVGVPVPCAVQRGDVELRPCAPIRPAGAVSLRSPSAGVHGVWRWLSLAWLWLHYLRSCVLPIRLNCDWSASAIPLLRSVADPRLLVLAVVFSAVACIMCVWGVPFSPCTFVKHVRGKASFFHVCLPPCAMLHLSKPPPPLPPFFFSFLK